MFYMIVDIVAFVLILHLQLSASDSRSDSRRVNFTSGQEDIITIQNGNEVLCLSKDRISPLFLSPPTVQDALNPSQMLLGLQGTDGWELEQLEDSVHKSIIDKRWEDFEIRFTNYLLYVMKNSFALSVYNLTNTLKLHLADDKQIKGINLTANSNELWTHISVVANDGELTIFNGDRIVGTFGNFKPTRLIAITHDEFFFKIHRYTYLYSDVLSKTPSEVSLPEETSCLVAYVSLCPSCFLFLGGNYFNYEEGWQRKEIEFDPPQRRFQIFRGSRSDDEKQFWKIDIRKCSKTKSGLTLVRYSSSQIPSQCHSLNSYHKSRDILSDTSPPSQCIAGSLGANCTLKCEDILGEEKKFCPQSKICETGKCFCSWGFKGPKCSEQCDEGEWGIDCRNKCIDNNCEFCDGVTGKCKGSYADGYSENNTPPTARNDVIKETVVIEIGVSPGPSTLLWISVGTIIGLVIVGIILTLRTALSNMRRSQHLTQKYILL